MATMVWDLSGKRTFEVGVDRGVLWLPNLDWVGIPWNGLTSVKETTPEYSTDHMYFDGERYHGASKIGDFEATVKAYTYPDEFEEVVGTRSLYPGLRADNQPGRQFHMSYRSLVGNDVDGNDRGYKIHLLYNLIANAPEKDRSTISDSVDSLDFEWELSSASVDLEDYDYLPTAHVVFDSRFMPTEYMTYIEEILYGTSLADPRLPSLPELIGEIETYGRLIITDNGDGTWTATGPDERFNMITADHFEILEANSVVVDANTYMVSSDPE